MIDTKSLVALVAIVTSMQGLAFCNDASERIALIDKANVGESIKTPFKFLPVSEDPLWPASINIELRGSKIAGLVVVYRGEFNTKRVRRRVSSVYESTDMEKQRTEEFSMWNIDRFT